MIAMHKEESRRIVVLSMQRISILLVERGRKVGFAPFQTYTPVLLI